MSMTDVEILKTLDEKNRELKNDLKDFMKSNNQALMVTLESETSKVAVKVDKIMEHNERQNGMLQSHENQILQLQKSASACRTHRHIMTGIWSHKYKILVALLILIGLVSWGMNKVNWYRTMEKKMDKYGIVLREPNDST